MRLWHRCFPVNLEKFLRTPLQEHLQVTAFEIRKTFLIIPFILVLSTFSLILFIATCNLEQFFFCFFFLNNEIPVLFAFICSSVRMSQKCLQSVSYAVEVPLENKLHSVNYTPFKSAICNFLSKNCYSRKYCYWQYMDQANKKFWVIEHFMIP